MEDLLDFSFRGLLRLLQGFIRIVIFLAWDCCLDFITWYVGWPVLRILTLGQYPKVGIKEEEQAPLGETIFVHIVGAVVLLSLAGIIAWLLQLPAISIQ